MLARLEAIEGVERAEVDHRGELLRLHASEAAIQDARRALSELGYAATEGRAVPSDARWYGSSTVRELSREEAKIISGRVLPDFALSHHLTPEDTERLSAAVADALYACFRAHTLGAGTPKGALRAGCSAQVAAAATGIVGAEAARELAASIEADLSRADGATSS